MSSAETTIVVVVSIQRHAIATRPASVVQTGMGMRMRRCHRRGGVTALFLRGGFEPSPRSLRHDDLLAVAVEVDVEVDVEVEVDAEVDVEVVNAGMVDQYSIWESKDGIPNYSFVLYCVME